MVDEVIDAPNGADEQVSAPDLRETIVAAVAQQREDAPPQQEIIPGDKPETAAEKAAKVIDDKGRAHDENGRFAAKPATDANPDAKPLAAAKPADGKEAPKADGETQPLKPPSSWSPTAKVEFDKLPQPVRDAIAKREQEVNNGFAKLAEYKPLDQFVEMAKSSGTTLDQALIRYVGIENALRADFVAGTITLAQQQNIHPVALAQHILARFGVSPTQNGEGGQQQANQTAGADLTPVLQKISSLETNFQTLQQERIRQEQAGIDSEIGRFASDPKHQFFDNVRADMGRLMESGQADSLDDAYDKACWANKEIRALLIKQQAAPSGKADDAVQRARAADKATGGAPAAGFKEAPAVRPGATIREIATAAVAAQRGL